MQTPPGRYDGRVRVGAREIPVELVVEPVTIDLAADPLVWVFYKPAEIALAHGVSDDDSPAQLEWEARYDALFRAHGAYLASDLLPERTSARRAYIRGARFWPVAIDLTSDAAIAASVASHLSLFRGSSILPFAIPIDEPTLADRSRLRSIAIKMGEAGAGPRSLLRSVTAPFSRDFEGVIDLYFSPHSIPEPARTRARTPGVERFFTYNGRPPESGSMILDTDGAALRTWGWIAFRYAVPLWHAWEGVYFRDRYNRGTQMEVFSRAITFDERRKGGEDFGNGDGLLVYPGPLPSFRLKALRRGLLDRLLLERLVACGGLAEARAIARRMVPRALGEGRGSGHWSRDERVWEAARGTVLDALVRRCPDAR